MKSDDLIEEINLYFDGELEKGKEPALFVLLSGNEEARKYFKKMNFLKTGIINSVTEFPEDLDARILRSASDSINVVFSHIKFFIAALSVAAILLLVSTWIFYSKSEEYKVRLVNLTREVNEKDYKSGSIVSSGEQAEEKTNRASNKGETGEYKLRLDELAREVKKQNDRIELILNALPQVEVKGNYLQTKQITVRQKI
jgi:hypothetical protein